MLSLYSVFTPQDWLRISAMVVVLVMVVFGCIVSKCTLSNKMNITLYGSMQ